LPNSFWVSPRLLAGEYPGAATAQGAKARLETLIAAGITYFIDLTQPGELPPYDHLLPPALGDDGRYVIYVRKAIQDYGVPAAPQAMQDTLDYIARALEVGHRVYVHCRAGIGRTNTVVGCWLRRSGLDGPAALERLNILWRANAQAGAWPRVPVTDQQVRYVIDWREQDEDPFGSLTLATARALRERYQGSLVGLACGDALGATLQFRVPGQFTPLNDMLGGGHWQLQPGAWTDDTAMALCLADSLLDTEECSATDQVRRYRRWQQDGYLSSTGQCLGLTAGVAGRLAEAAADVPLSAQALPRAGAVALFGASQPERVFEWVQRSVALTDPAPEAIAAAQGHAACLLAALRGAQLANLLAEAREFLRLHGTDLARALGERLVATRGAPPAAPAADPRDVLRWIVAVLHQAADYREGLLYIVNRGGDADIHGAIFGQLAGALYGIGAIPKIWRHTLLRRELLTQYADRLLVAALAPRAL
jgi:ADP-ribosylglycohydrolase